MRRERGTKGELTTLLWCEFPISPATTLMTCTKAYPTMDPAMEHRRSEVGTMLRMPYKNTINIEMIKEELIEPRELN
eukprot:8884032-Ditylum_brightwellii.AAC.2